MNHLLKFRSFQKLNPDNGLNPIEEYITGKIDESELEEFFIQEISALNESIISDTISKLSDWFLEKCLKLYELITSSSSKLIGLANSIIGALRRFSKKYPLLCKVIIIFITIAVILMVSSVYAKAAVTGTPPNERVINGAIGMLENAKTQYMNLDIDVQSSMSSDVFKNASRADILSEAQTFLLSLKPGKAASDPSHFSEAAKRFADLAINQVREIVKQGTDDQKEALINISNKGAKLVSSSIEEIIGIGGKKTHITQSWEGGNPFIRGNK